MLQNKNIKEKKSKLIEFPYIPVAGPKHSRKKQSKIAKPVKSKLSGYSVHDNLWFESMMTTHSYSSSVGINTRRRSAMTSFDSIVRHSMSSTPTVKKEVKNKRVTTNTINRNETRIMFELVDGYLTSIGLINSPTYNCQLASLRQACNLKHSLKEDREEIVKTIKYESGKKQILLDIQQFYEKEIEEIFKDYVIEIVKSPYTNSNGTKMILYIYKWNEKLEELCW